MMFHPLSNFQLCYTLDSTYYLSGMHKNDSLTMLRGFSAEKLFPLTGAVYFAQCFSSVEGFCSLRGFSHLFMYHTALEIILQFCFESLNKSFPTSLGHCIWIILHMERRICSKANWEPATHNRLAGFATTVCWVYFHGTYLTKHFYSAFERAGTGTSLYNMIDSKSSLICQLLYAEICDKIWSKSSSCSHLFLYF